MLDFEDLFFDGAPVKVKVKGRANANASGIARAKAKVKIPLKPGKTAQKPSKAKTASGIHFGAGQVVKRLISTAKAGRALPSGRARAAPSRPAHASGSGTFRASVGAAFGARRGLFRQSQAKPRSKGGLFALAAKVKAKAAQKRKSATIGQMMKPRKPGKKRSFADFADRIKSQVQQTSAKPSKPGTGLQLSKLPDVANKLTPKKRKKLAAKIGLRGVRKIARKAPFLRPSQSSATTHAKAVAAIRPIAEACKCPAPAVVKEIDAQMACQGYPPGSTKNILASIHDMNAALEKAAIQRLATHEHNTLSAQDSFEKRVLEQLARIAKKLPPCHPTRTRAHLNILNAAGSLRRRSSST